MKLFIKNGHQFHEMKTLRNFNWKQWLSYLRSILESKVTDGRIRILSEGNHHLTNFRVKWYTVLHVLFCIYFNITKLALSDKKTHYKHFRTTFLSMLVSVTYFPCVHLPEGYPPHTHTWALCSILTTLPLSHACTYACSCHTYTHLYLPHILITSSTLSYVFIYTFTLSTRGYTRIHSYPIPVMADLSNVQT